LKKAKSTYQDFLESSPRNRRLLREEEILSDVAAELAEALQRRGVTRTQFAGLLGRSKGYVSQILAGDRNLTLRTVADAADALDHEVKLTIRPAQPAVNNVLGKVLSFSWRAQPAHESFELCEDAIR
jgi:transcriptional regulator with XRE-family HTH domain